MSLLPTQLAFYDFLEKNAPYLMELWDWRAAEVRLDLVEAYLARASHQQAIMCRFAVNIWLGRDHFEMKLSDAASVLEFEQRECIANWLLQPFWP